MAAALLLIGRGGRRRRRITRREEELIDYAIRWRESSLSLPGAPPILPRELILLIDDVRRERVR